MFKKVCIFSLLLIKISFSGASLFAQRESELEPMVVVETRSPVPLSEASPWVTRISGDDLEQRQIYNLSDALRSVPGMAVVRSGQMGSQTSLFSRGGASNHTAYIYEGRSLNGGFSGTYNLGELSTLGASSLEVLKGASSINGANAMGGTVHVRNELLLSDGYDSNIGVSFGSFDTLISNYNTRFKDGNWAGNFSFSSLDTVNDRPHSKFESLSSSFLIENQLTDGLTVNFLGLGYDNYLGSNFYKPSIINPNNYQETVHFLISPQVKVETDFLDSTLNYSYSEDEIEPSNPPNSYTEQENLDFLSNILLSDRSSLRFGLGYSTTRFSKSGNLLDSWEQTYASLGFRHELSQDTILNGNVHYSDYSDFETSETYDLKARTSITESFSVHAKYGTGFAPPEALDLYDFPQWMNVGNPDLKAEKSRNLEIGFVYQDDEKKNVYGLTCFFNKYNNLIVSDYDVIKEGFFAQNIKKTESIGLEISSQTQIKQSFYLDASISYAKSKNLDLDSNEDFLARRPEIFGSISLIYEKEAFMIGSELISKYKTKEKNWDWITPDPKYGKFVDADDYTVARLLSSYKFENGFGISARVENLFDKEYSEVHGYPALGRAFHAGLNYSF